MNQKLLSSDRSPRRSLEEIRALLVQQAQSGLSLLAFAQAHDLCYASLRRWRLSHAASIKNHPEQREARRLRSTPGFISVQLEDSAPVGEFILSWSGNRSLRIPAKFDAVALHRLLQVLEARS